MGRRQFRHCPVISVRSIDGLRDSAQILLGSAEIALGDPAESQPSDGAARKRARRVQLIAGVRSPRIGDAGLSLSGDVFRERLGREGRPSHVRRSQAKLRAKEIAEMR